MPAGWHNITHIDDLSVIRLQSQQSPEAGTYRPATRSIERLSNEAFWSSRSITEPHLLIFRTMWHNRQRFWPWIKYAVRLGGWKREWSSYEFAWKRSMKVVKPDPRWQGQCLPVVYTWRERLICWHHIRLISSWQCQPGSIYKVQREKGHPICHQEHLSL